MRCAAFLLLLLAGCGGPRHSWLPEQKAWCKIQRDRSRCVRLLGAMQARVEAAEDQASSAQILGGAALGLAAGAASK